MTNSWNGKLPLRALALTASAAGTWPLAAMPPVPLGAPIYPGPFYVCFASGGAEIEEPGARMLDYAATFYADMPARCAVT
ncbi:MAG: hypothetical protein JWP15_3657, partial [Alphaproteobacteria bacterium]|nr:hypothetical protein [Alphaproteobacteria bacterium]